MNYVFRWFDRWHETVIFAPVVDGPQLYLIFGNISRADSLLTYRFEAGKTMKIVHKFETLKSWTSGEIPPQFQTAIQILKTSPYFPIGLLVGLLC